MRRGDGRVAGGRRLHGRRGGVIVAVLLTVALVLARVVAETGLVYTQMGVATFKPWLLMAQYGAAKPATAETFFYAGVLNVTTTTGASRCRSTPPTPCACPTAPA